MPLNRKPEELLPTASADRAAGVRLRKIEEIRVNHNPGRSTYPDKKSVLTSESTPVFHIQEDRDLLAAWAIVGIRHSQLDYALRMSIKTLAGLPTQVALDATAFQGSAQLRERIAKLTRKRLGEGVPLLRVQAILERCRGLTPRRNELTHNIVARDLDELEPAMMLPGQISLPSVAELNTLANELAQVTSELNTARLRGWLDAALRERPLDPIEG